MGSLPIKERASEDKSRTVKEMLEEILMKEYQNETTINQIFLQVLDPNNRIESSKVDIVKNKLKSYKEEAQVRAEQFIDGKE